MRFCVHTSSDSDAFLKICFLLTVDTGEAFLTLLASILIVRVLCGQQCTGLFVPLFHRRESALCMLETSCNNLFAASDSIARSCCKRGRSVRAHQRRRLTSKRKPKRAPRL